MAAATADVVKHLPVDVIAAATVDALLAAAAIVDALVAAAAIVVDHHAVAMVAATVDAPVAAAAVPVPLVAAIADATADAPVVASLPADAKQADAEAAVSLCSPDCFLAISSDPVAAVAARQNRHVVATVDVTAVAPVADAVATQHVVATADVTTVARVADAVVPQLVVATADVTAVAPVVANLPAVVIPVAPVAVVDSAC